MTWRSGCFSSGVNTAPTAISARTLVRRCARPAPAARPTSAAGNRLSLRCPWHGWEFDLRTGAFVGNPRCTLDAYRVEIVDGAVCVWA